MHAQGQVLWKMLRIGDSVVTGLRAFKGKLSLEFAVV